MFSSYKNFKNVLVKTETKCRSYNIGEVQSNRILDINGKLITCYVDNGDNIYVKEFGSLKCYRRVTDDYYMLLTEFVFS